MYQVFEYETRNKFCLNVSSFEITKLLLFSLFLIYIKPFLIHLSLQLQFNDILTICQSIAIMEANISPSVRKMKNIDNDNDNFYVGRDIFKLPNGDIYDGEYMAHRSGLVWREGMYL